MALGAVLGLTSCSNDPAPPPPAVPRPTSSSAAASASQAGANLVPAWQQQANFDALANTTRRALIKVYPLQRIGGRLLLTVDLVAQGTPGEKLVGLNYLCRCAMRGDLGDVSLVDPVARVRYGPLRAGSITGKPYSSNIKYLFHPVGSTYRVGGFYPDPGPGVTSMGVDLQAAGIAPAIPIVDGGQPAPDLVPGLSGTAAGTATTDPGASTPAADATPDPGATVQSPTGGDGGGVLVTWSVPTPGPDAVVDRHDLIANVVGGTVNESGGRKHGIVTLNADVLFGFNSAKLSPQAAALVAQSRSILSSKADPAQPLVVTGYTDSKGTPAFNQTLSRKRTTAVAKTLRSEGFTSFRLRVSGRGEDDPVALNATESGADNPRGRALNRRVEITYTPKPTPEPAPVATATTSTAPTATTAETPAAENSAAVITLPQANVKSDGVSMARMTVGVHPVIETGALSLVQLDITAVHDTLLLDAFSARAKADQDISAFSIVDPATKRVYVPAYDADDRERVAGTYTRRLSAGQPQHLAFYAAALPPGLTTATVDLGQLGSAKRVTVVH